MALGDDISGEAHEIIHELRNALGLVINYAALVASDVRDQPAVLADIAEIASAGRRAAELVDQLAALIPSDPG